MYSASGRLRRTCAVAVAASLPLLFAVPDADASGRHKPRHSKSVSVRLIGFNDLHGNLKPPTGSSGRVTTVDAIPAQGDTPAVPAVTVDAGGAAYLATHVDQLQSQARHSVLVSSGDSIGGTPLESSLFHDEPTIEVLNSMGVDASAVGNHEFDEGYEELLRIQDGGCHPSDGCEFRETYEGTDFPYLGANVTFKDGGEPALLPYTVEVRGGVPIGIIGVTLRDVPTLVVPTGVADLDFGDEVEAIDRTSKMLQRRGVKAQVVLLHQGDLTTGTGGPNSCSVTEVDAAREIATRATARVDAFFTGHTHQAVNCSVVDPAGQPRPLIQGLAFGRLLSVVDLQINRRSRDVIRERTHAFNHIVTRTVTPDPEVAAIVARADELAAPIAARPVGSISETLLGRNADSPERPLGKVVADAQLAATTANGAQVAITNPGGLRDDLNFAASPGGGADGVVTYGEAFQVQPFANILQTVTLTGAQLKTVLEQQVQPNGSTTFLQVSSTLNYTWTTGAPTGSKVSNLTINGTAVDPATSYRVTVNNFLAAGGDNFAGFTAGTDLTGGPIDLDAFTSYLAANPNLSAPAGNRITVVG